MSVPEFLRKSRTMQVYIKARNILNHTRKILSSEKSIPKRHRHDYADRLDSEALHGSAGKSRNWARKWATAYCRKEN